MSGNRWLKIDEAKKKFPAGISVRFKPSYIATLPPGMQGCLYSDKEIYVVDSYDKGGAIGLENPALPFTWWVMPDDIVADADPAHSEKHIQDWLDVYYV